MKGVPAFKICHKNKKPINSSLRACTEFLFVNLE